MIFTSTPLEVDLKAKRILTQPNDEIYVTGNRFLITLKWTASVDLDLMAFYKTRDGKEGGIFASDYPGGTLGSLKQFPYMKLHTIRGVSYEEVLGISKLDDFLEVYICTVNYRQKYCCFKYYDAGINVLYEKGNTVGIPITSRDIGEIAVIAKIDNTSFISPKLINQNRVMDLLDFAHYAPGGQLLCPLGGC